MYSQTSVISFPSNSSTCENFNAVSRQQDYRFNSLDNLFVIDPEGNHGMIIHNIDNAQI